MTTKHHKPLKPAESQSDKLREFDTSLAGKLWLIIYETGEINKDITLHKDQEKSRQLTEKKRMLGHLEQ